MSNGWIGVDLDGTLAHYEPGYSSNYVIGEPLQPMLDRVKAEIARGTDVRIFTARVAYPSSQDPRAQLAKRIIEAWCLNYFGQVLPITNAKDWDTIEIWDDRARQVVFNSGEFV